MNFGLKDFQLEAIRKLNEGMVSDKREIVLKSCTGSGKTIILTHFMDEYIKSYANIVFVWLTPGKGELENQSKKKMDKYIPASTTKDLADIMTSGFTSGDCCFINWEKLTKKGNNALKDGERTNFKEWIEKAHNDNISFVIIVDESHQNDTIKADEIIELFNTEKIIRCSATPKPYANAYHVDVPEEDVIAEGLIKKLLVINEDFPRTLNVDDQVSYLLERALEKQRALHAEYLQRGVSVNPLIVIQMPNKSDALLDDIERYLEKNGITYENDQLAIWLSDRKQNLEDIEEPNANPVAVIIKQAVATGWDCPRAQILVKLRDNMSETFEIQTIGRIRRMPEAHHYESELLDCCYLYTLDEKFTEGVKLNLGKGALDKIHLTLKSEHRLFSIVTEYKTNVPTPRDSKLVLQVIAKYFEKKYKTDGKTIENKNKLEAYGYVFDSKIVKHARSGAVSTLTREQFNDLNVINIGQGLDTHKHGREMHHCLAEIGLKITLPYDSIRTIAFRLFTKKQNYSGRILSLEIPELYAFIINNTERLKDDIAAAMADESSFQLTLGKNVTEKPMGFPQRCEFYYDKNAKVQTVLGKNVYNSYLSSAEVRSASERLFEHYCENSPKVAWFYKNGDKGPEYFSIVYQDSFQKQKSFYPDYIIGTIDGQIWIIETKGGFNRYGQSEDIDTYTAKKFGYLKKYIDKYKKLGGIVRQDKQSQQLCICTDNYSHAES